MATDPHLLALLRAAASRPMTRDEVTAQRRSWVIGELMLAHPEMTRDEAERHVRTAESQVYGP